MDRVDMLYQKIKQVMEPLDDKAIDFFCDSIELHIKKSVEIVEKCETPIEKLLAMALFTMKYLQFPRFYFKIDIKPQEPLECKSLYDKDSTEKYRVDFLLLVEINNKEFKYVIECDGHDFHEKTKEQALKDKKRDRTLMFNDYQVMRFTGSEIWADPAFCAFDIYRVIAKNS